MHALVSLCLLLVLASCGGGGGGGGGAPAPAGGNPGGGGNANDPGAGGGDPGAGGQPEITANNAECIARNVLGVFLGPQELLPPCSLIEAVATVGTGNIATVSGKPRLSVPALLLSEALTMTVVPCLNGGSTTVEIDFVEDPELPADLEDFPLDEALASDPAFGRVFAGDYVSLTMANCDQGGGVITNGIFRDDTGFFDGEIAAGIWRKISEVTHNDLQTTWTDLSWTAAAVTITSNRNERVAIEVNGEFRSSESFAGVNTLVTSDGRTSECRGCTLTFIHDPSLPQPDIAEANGTITSNEFDTDVPLTFQTLETFIVGGSDYASDGKLRILDGTGSFIDCTVLDGDNVFLEIAYGNDGEIDETRNYTWDELFYGNVPRN